MPKRKANTKKRIKKIVPTRPAPIGTHYARTKKEKRVEDIIMEKNPVGKDTRYTGKKLGKNVPSVVFVDNNRVILETGSHSKYNPLYSQWTVDYVTECYQSYERRERFLQTVANMETQEVTTGVTEDGLPIVTKRMSTTLKEEREKMENTDRYVPIIKLPNMAGLAMYFLTRHKVALTKAVLTKYRTENKDFKYATDILMQAQEDLIQQHSTNGIGSHVMHKLQLLNNHDWKDTKNIEAEVGVSLKGLFDNLYDVSHLTSTSEKLMLEAKGKDVNHAPLDE